MSSNVYSYALSSAEQDLVTNVFISDRRGDGRALSPEEVPIARSLLKRVICDHVALRSMINKLAEMFQTTFRYAKPRRDRTSALGAPEPAPTPQRFRSVDDVEEAAPPTSRHRLASAQGGTATGFRYTELLAEETALQIAHEGLEVLPDSELPRLLLNPFALWDLADLVSYTLPDYWLDQMEAIGEHIMSDEGVEPSDFIDAAEVDQSLPYAEQEEDEEMLAGSVPFGRRMRSAEEEPVGVPLKFDGSAGALRGRIAAHLYGDENTEFTLTLYRSSEPDQEGRCAVELEVGPAPIKQELTLRLVFPSGDACDFPLTLPESSRPATRVPGSVKVPSAALQVSGTCLGDEGVWPPKVMVR